MFEFAGGSEVRLDCGMTENEGVLTGAGVNEQLVHLAHGREGAGGGGVGVNVAVDNGADVIGICELNAEIGFQTHSVDEASFRIFVELAACDRNEIEGFAVAESRGIVDSGDFSGDVMDAENRIVLGSGSAC